MPLCIQVTPGPPPLFRPGASLVLISFVIVMRLYVVSYLTASLFCISTFSAIPPWNPPLSTRGRYIVDAQGNRFKLKSANWHGASGTWNGEGDPAFDINHHCSENSYNLPLGLQYVPIADILDSIEQTGVNSVRLPFSADMVKDTRAVQDDWVAANPQLRGKTPLEVYDAVVEALTARGFAVILNNHTVKSRWCCSVNDQNERWNESQTDAEWADVWLLMVRRYKDNKQVVGADLYNEVRRSVMDDPNWGLGNNFDWFAASQWLGDRILMEANPDLLIIVEGINWIGLPIDGFPHSRPTLSPAAGLSHTFSVPNKLVYSAHYYGYTGSSHSGAFGIGETTDLRYQDMDHNTLCDVVRQEASYIALDQEQHYTAPLWVSEFGVQGQGFVNRTSQRWFNHFVQYLIGQDLDFAFWPLTGYLSYGSGNGWALLSWDLGTNKRVGIYDGHDWRAKKWKQLVSSPGYSGYVPPVPQFKMLNIDHTDFIQSPTLRSRPDWDPGAFKATCPDGMRLLGLSHGANRGLCTDKGYEADLWLTDRTTQVVTDESFVSQEWATGYTKFECPKDTYAIGYSFRGIQLSSLLCATAKRGLGLEGRTIWFDRENGGEPIGGDFAYGLSKGVCAAEEYLAGVAFTTNIFNRVFNRVEPAAIFCRR